MFGGTCTFNGLAAATAKQNTIRPKSLLGLTLAAFDPGRKSARQFAGRIIRFHDVVVTPSPESEKDVGDETRWNQPMSLVADFYKDAQKEWDRLDIPLCRIELASTLD